MDRINDITKISNRTLYFFDIKLKQNHLFLNCQNISSFNNERVKLSLLDFKLDSNNHNLLYQKVEPLGYKSYVFDNVFEMIYFYELYKDKIENNSSFYVFNEFLNKELALILNESLRDKEVYICFNNNYRTINYLIILLNLVSINYKIQNNIDSYIIFRNEKIVEIAKKSTKLYLLAKKLKINSIYKTLKVNKNFTNFKTAYYEQQ